VINRRAFLGAIAGGLLAAPLAAEAEQAGKVYRIGLLSANAAGVPRLTGPSVKDSVTSVTSRAATS
jgi:hypothetical protein